MQTNDAETAEQIAALGRLRSALEPLEQLLVEEGRASGEFNLFELLNQRRREEAHSRVLTWLLDPNGNHGVGDYFLEKFLLATYCRLDVGDYSNWSQATAQREWFHEIDETRGSLDILVVDYSKRFLCAIENKVDHSESPGQLNRYRRALEQKFPPDFTRHFVFLTRAGISPQSEEERAHWICASYTDIRELVERSINERAGEMRDDVRVLLRHYANTVGRIIVPESIEIQQLARQIYLEHRDAVERVQKSKPDYQREIKQRLEEAINERDDWTLVRPSDDDEFVSFRPDALEDFKVFKRSGADYDRLLWFGFGFSKEGNMWFQIELAPVRSKALREMVEETFRQHKDLFQRIKSYGAGAMRLHESDWLLEDADLGARWDTDVVRDKVDQFASNEFPSMLEVIVNCLREYEAETKGQ